VRVEYDICCALSYSTLTYVVRKIYTYIYIYTHIYTYICTHGMTYIFDIYIESRIWHKHTQYETKRHTSHIQGGDDP